MKRNLFLSLLGSILILSIFALIFPSLKINKKLPSPIETRIVQEDEAGRQSEKLQWIEQMHRAAPGENWRSKDFNYRMQQANGGRQNRQTPIYGMWREVGSDNQAGRTLFAYYDQSTDNVYVASDGGQIWKGPIGTSNWQSINDNFRIGSIHFIRKVDAFGGKRLLIGSGMRGAPGFLYTSDEGNTWHTANGLDNIVSWGYIKRVIIPDTVSNTIYLLAQEWDNINWSAMTGLYKSTDLGSSFSRIASLPVNADNADMWATQGSQLYVLASNTLYTLSSQGVLSQLSAISGQTEGNTLLTGFKAGDGDYLYALVRTDNQSHFYASTAGGMNWQAKAVTDEGPFMVNSFKASIQEKDVLYFGGVNAYTSVNAGQSWQMVNQWYEYYNSPEDKLHADIPGFNSYLDNEGNEFTFVNTDGGVYISYDKVDNVQNLSLEGLRISQYYSTYTNRFDPRYTHAGAQDQGYQMSDEGNQTGQINYEQVISGDYGNIVSGDGGASVWMVYPGFAMYVGNANTGGGLVTGDFVGSNYQWLPKLMDDPADPHSVYIAGGGQAGGAHIFHLHQSGNQIIYSELPFDFSNGTNADLTAMAYSPLNPDYRYVLTSDQLFFYSTDGGASWTQTPGFTGPESHYFYGASIAPSKTELGTVYVGGSGYSSPAVFKSTNHGQSFVSYSSGLPNTLVFQLALSDDDSLLFAASEIGPFVCKTWENEWYPLSDSITPDQSYWAVEYVPVLKVARFSTYGRGVWDFELDPAVQANFTADKRQINQGDTVNFTDLSQGNPISWEWYFEGAVPDTSTEENPMNIVYNQAGNFDVRLIVHNQNHADTLQKIRYIIVAPATSVEENSLTSALLKIYPNPAKNYLNLEFSAFSEKGEISIYNAESARVRQLKINPGTKNTRMDVSSLSGGVYYFILKDEEGRKVQTGKVVVEH